MECGEAWWSLLKDHSASQKNSPSESSAPSDEQGTFNLDPCSCSEVTVDDQTDFLRKLEQTRANASEDYKILVDNTSFQ